MVWSFKSGVALFGGEGKVRTIVYWEVHTGALNQTPEIQKVEPLKGS